MENATIDIVYKHILQIEQRLEKLEDILEIPEAEISGEELEQYKKTLKAMKEGKEGISLEDYKKSQS